MPRLPGAKERAQILAAVQAEGQRVAELEATELDAVVEPPEIADLPMEVIQLVHAVDRMRDGWADGDDARRQSLWEEVHTANDAVWGRLDAKGGDHGDR